MEMQKLLDVSELTRLGWSAKTKLRDGIGSLFRFLANAGKQSGRCSKAEAHSFPCWRARAMLEALRL